jgi:hypothetical protein
MSSSYQVVLWKQESFVVLRPLQIEFFRNLLRSNLMKQGLRLSLKMFLCASVLTVTCALAIAQDSANKWPPRHSSARA